jgi:hypothetical protein
VGELRQDLEELHLLLEEGALRRAYVAIVSYMSGLRNVLATAHKDWSITGLYQGYFDMTYFAVVTPSLKARDLKLALVFDYTAFRFEVWLAARNRTVQRRYWELLRNSEWSPESLVEPAVGVDAIVVAFVGGGLDLDGPEALTASFQRVAERLSSEIEEFLDLRDPLAG